MKAYTKILFLTVIFFNLVLLSCPSNVLASLAVEIPCLSGTNCPSAATPAGYVARIYQFGLMIAGLAAFGALVFGAIKYILSAGSIVSQQDAKDQMTSAIWGLLLLLGAYLILYTINPDLVNLRNPSTAPVTVPPASSGSAATSGGTPNNPLTPTDSSQTPIQLPTTYQGTPPSASGGSTGSMTKVAPTTLLPLSQIPSSATKPQTGCVNLNMSSADRVTISGQVYWACNACGEGYLTQGKICEPL